MRLKLPKNINKLSEVVHAFLSVARDSRVDKLDCNVSFCRQRDASITVINSIKEALDGGKFRVLLVKRSWSFEPPYWELSFDYEIDNGIVRFIWIDVSCENLEILKKQYNLKDEV